MTARLTYRRPFDDALFAFLAARCIPGIEEVSNGVYRRSSRLPNAAGIVELTPRDGHVECVVNVDDPRDAATAVARCRALLDLDADPAAINAHLGRDPHLAPLVREAPGRRVPGTADAFELAVRAVLGQQVSVAGARTLASRLVAVYGRPLTTPVGGVTHVFPSPDALADAGFGEIGMPAARKLALRSLGRAVAEGDVVLDGTADRAEVVESLLALPGIGPWTASYVAMRALGDRDVFLAGDLGVRKAAAALGLPGSPRALDSHAKRWSPWRSYAVMHLWASLSG